MTIERWIFPNVAANHVDQSSADTNIGTATNNRLSNLKDLAFEQGYQDGLNQAKNETENQKTELDQQIELLKTIIHTVTKPFEDECEAIEGQVTQLAIVIAKEVVRREVSTEPEQLLNYVREALKCLPLNQDLVKIQINPEDLKIIRSVLTVDESQQSGWHFIEDQSVSRGGCRLETQYSTVDATIEKRITDIAEKIMGGKQEGDT